MVLKTSSNDLVHWKGDVDNVNPNVKLDISKNLVTKLTWHELSDMFDSALRKRLRIVRYQNTQ